MDDIKDLIRHLGQELGRSLGESMIETVRAEMPRLRAELGLAAGEAGVSGIVRRPASHRGAKVSMALMKPCPVPDCHRPGRGPRFSFLCEVHRDLPAGEREKYRVRPKR